MSWTNLGAQLINAGIPEDLIADVIRDAGDDPALFAYCLRHYGADLQIAVDVLEQRLGQQDSPEEAQVRDGLVT